jgi:hypothetical protein
MSSEVWNPAEVEDRIRDVSNRSMYAVAGRGES